jgi:hypothetical protein
MFQVNPMMLIQMIKQGKNPQQLMMSVLEGSASMSPIGANLLQLAKNNDVQGIEKFARNVFQSRGLDYDKEFNLLKQTLGIK